MSGIMGPNVVSVDPAVGGVRAGAAGYNMGGAYAAGTGGGFGASTMGGAYNGGMSSGIYPGSVAGGSMVGGPGAYGGGLNTMSSTTMATGMAGNGAVLAGPGGVGVGMGGGGQVVPGGMAANDSCCGPSASAGDCAGSCGGAERLCCEAAGSVSSVQWVQVGAGGSYNPTTTYSYAGEGAGSYDRQVVTSYYGWRVRKCCLGLLGLLLLAGLLYLLSQLTNTEVEQPIVSEAPEIIISTPPPSPAPPVPTPAPVPPPPPPPPPTTPPPPPTPAPTQPPVPVPVPVPSPTAAPVPVGPPGTCLIFGDPHVKTFDGIRADYYTAGEYWIVKSDTVWIQGRYLPTKMTNTLSVTKEIAIGGPFLGGHKLVIGVEVVTYDGVPVMSGFDKLDTTWSNPKPEISIVYNSQGTVMQKSREGKALHVVHVTLPDGVALEVNRWAEPEEGHYINSRLMMPKQPGQDGHCGNFNGDPADDKRVAVRDRVGRKGVDAGQMIMAGPKTPINPGNRPDLNDCPEGELAKAMATCKAVEHKFFPSEACLIDTCLGHMAPH